jgi:hypothetical protein
MHARRTRKVDDMEVPASSALRDAALAPEIKSASGDIEPCFKCPCGNRKAATISKFKVLWISIS